MSPLPHSIFGFIFYFVRKQWLKFTALTCISIVWAVNDTFFPYFLKCIVNTLSSVSGDRSHVFLVVKSTLILLVAFWLIMEVSQRIGGIIGIYTFPKFRSQMREVVFEYVRKHSHEYFSSHFAGNISKRISDLPSSSETIVEIILFQFITAAVGSTIVLIMMWQTKPLFALILFMWLFFHLSFTALYLKYGNPQWVTHSDKVSNLSGKIVDVFSNILSVRLFAHDRFESEHLHVAQHAEIKQAKKAMWVMELTRIGLGFSGLFLILGMILTLLYGWSHYWVSLGDFTQVSMQSFWLLGWIWFISYQITVLAREMGTVGNALSIIRQPHQIMDLKDAAPIKIIKGEIQFDHVGFSYSKNRKVFENFNLTISGGQKVGLVGSSGSGKSTFVNLLLRFYDVQSGKILIDGQNIADVTQASLRSQIAMIPQDPSLFHRTLMENIRYGCLDATDEEVIEASKMAHCHEFIEKMEGGYQAMVGERGTKLSGGQRQRIAIARAILKNAPILILDEATSALDSVTERLIQESLEYLMQGKTTLVVAHRLSTLSDMDRILVFDKGRVVEDGPQDVLLENEEGEFAKLWNMQMDGFLPDDEEEDELEE